jgi:hypothetical protein
VVHRDEESLDKDKTWMDGQHGDITICSMVKGAAVTMEPMVDPVWMLKLMTLPRERHDT